MYTLMCAGYRVKQKKNLLSKPYTETKQNEKYKKQHVKVRESTCLRTPVCCKFGATHTVSTGQPLCYELFLPFISPWTVSL